MFLMGLSRSLFCLSCLGDTLAYGSGLSAHYVAPMIFDISIANFSDTSIGKIQTGLLSLSKNSSCST